MDLVLLQVISCLVFSSPSTISFSVGVAWDGYINKTPSLQGHPSSSKSAIDSLQITSKTRPLQTTTNITAIANMVTLYSLLTVAFAAVTVNAAPSLEARQDGSVRATANLWQNAICQFPPTPGTSNILCSVYEASHERSFKLNKLVFFNASCNSRCSFMRFYTNSKPR